MLPALQKSQVDVLTKFISGLQSMRWNSSGSFAGYFIHPFTIENLRTFALLPRFIFTLRSVPQSFSSDITSRIWLNGIWRLSGLLARSFLRCSSLYPSAGRKIFRLLQNALTV